MPAPETPRERKCPICGKPAEPAARPFCSARCRNLDLHRWLSDAYAIPVAGDAADDGEPREE